MKHLQVFEKWNGLDEDARPVTSSNPINTSNLSSAVSSLHKNAKSISWGSTEFIQKGMRNNEKVKALQELMRLVSSKGKNLVTGYFGPMTDGGLAMNNSDIYKKGQKVDKKLYDQLIDRLATNTTYTKDKGLIQGDKREDIA
jgi:hypothetical protein